MGFAVKPGKRVGFRPSEVTRIVEALREYKSFVYTLGCGLGLYGAPCANSELDTQLNYVAYAAALLASQPYTVGVRYRGDTAYTVIGFGRRRLCTIYAHEPDERGNIVYCAAGVTVDELERFAQRVLDTLFTATVFACDVLTGRQHERPHYVDSVASAMVRLAEMGAVMDPGVYNKLREVFELSKKRVYRVGLPPEKAIGMLEDMRRRLKSNYAWSLSASTEVGVLDVAVEVDMHWVGRPGRHHVTDGVRVTIAVSQTIDGSNTYPVYIDLTYWIDEDENGEPAPLLSVQPDKIDVYAVLRSPLPLDTLTYVLGNWRELTIYALKKSISDKAVDENYTEVVKTLIEIFENIGDEVKKY